MRSCLTVYQSSDGTRSTFIVYGPSAKEFKYERPLGSLHLERGTLIHVEDTEPYRSEEVRRRPWWERDQRPTSYYFSKHLGREPISSGAGPYLVGAPNGEAGEGSTELGRVDREGGWNAGRSLDIDGGEE